MGADAGGDPVLTGMALILSQIGDVVESAVDWLGTFAGVIADNDVLVLLVVAVPLVGLGVGLLKRMISL